MEGRDHHHAALRATVSAFSIIAWAETVRSFSNGLQLVKYLMPSVARAKQRRNQLSHRRRLAVSQSMEQEKCTGQTLGRI